MFKDLIADLQSGLDSFQENKKSCLKDIGEELKSKAQRHTPVSTGKLKNSYEVKITQDDVELTNATDYAIYVNDGHSTKGGSSFVPGKRMMEKALSEMPATITHEVNKLLDETKLF